ncbi:hypothetical protein [Deinococcus arenicola]|uniref:Uncharacterized protein n=1 Tax=Deinococcus arenicola TaxID=2994950 RepID=A0ABU4DNU8_9DEIO|nr:hypothetical protein [Deinococcus sp. ZS9-10]MDV6374110.1 hypothetical protein [Deinococcus sp. ZS9-10]
MIRATPVKKHHQDRPDFAAALRSVAWTYQHTGTPFAPKDIQAVVQRTRQDMGLPPYMGGAVSDYLQRRTKGTKLQQQDNQPIHYVADARKLIPAPSVMENWRFLGASDHALIRLTAFQGVLQEMQSGQFSFSTRSSHLPSLTVLVGPIAEVRQAVAQNFKGRSGLYLLKRNDKNYVGQTHEFEVRGRRHGSTGAEFVLFAFPEETDRMDSDVLNVAESLTLVSLSELLNLENEKLGGDRPPKALHLREGSAFAVAFVAAVFRWAHQHPQQWQQFLMWRRDVRGLADAYLTLQPYAVPTPEVVIPAVIPTSIPAMSAPSPLGESLPADWANLIRAVVLGGEGGTLTLLGPIDGQGEFLLVRPRLVDIDDDDFGVYDGADLIPAGRELIGALDLVNPGWRSMVGVYVAPIFEEAVQRELALVPDACIYDKWRLDFEDAPMQCRYIWPSCDLWPDGLPRDAFWVEGNLDQVREVLGGLAPDHQMQLETAASEPFVVLISRDGSQRLSLPHIKSSEKEGTWPTDVFVPIGWHEIRHLDDLRSLWTGVTDFPDVDPGLLLLEPALRRYEMIRQASRFAYPDRAERGLALQQSLWEMAQITWPFQVMQTPLPAPSSRPAFTVYMIHGQALEESLWHFVGDHRERDAIRLSIVLRNLYYSGNRDALSSGEISYFLNYALPAVQQVNTGIEPSPKG